MTGFFDVFRSKVKEVFTSRLPSIHFEVVDGELTFEGKYYPKEVFSNFLAANLKCLRKEVGMGKVEVVFIDLPTAAACFKAKIFSEGDLARATGDYRGITFSLMVDGEEVMVSIQRETLKCGIEFLLFQPFENDRMVPGFEF